MRIININGVLYSPRENENGIYMQRVNADGSDWVDTAPKYTQAEIDSGIGMVGTTGYVGTSVVAPTKITITERESRKSIWRRLRDAWKKAFRG